MRITDQYIIIHYTYPFKMLVQSYYTTYSVWGCTLLHNNTNQVKILFSNHLRDISLTMKMKKWLLYQGYLRDSSPHMGYKYVFKLKREGGWSGFYF